MVDIQRTSMYYMASFSNYTGSYKGRTVETLDDVARSRGLSLRKTVGIPAGLYGGALLGGGIAGYQAGNAHRKKQEELQELKDRYPEQYGPAADKYDSEQLGRAAGNVGRGVLYGSVGGLLGAKAADLYFN